MARIDMEELGVRQELTRPTEQDRQNGHAASESCEDEHEAAYLEYVPLIACLKDLERDALTLY